MPSLVFKTTSSKNMAVPVRVGGHAARLQTALTTAATTSLVVAAPGIPAAVASGDVIAVISQGLWTVCTASASAAAGATTITVNSFTPTQAMPVGSIVKDFKWPGGEREYIVGQNIPHDIPVEDYGEVAAFLDGAIANSTVTKGPKDH